MECSRRFEAGDRKGRESGEATSLFLLSGVPPGLGWAGRGGGEGGGGKFNFKRHHGSVAVAFGAFVPAAASETVRGGLGNVLSNTFS